LIPKRSEEGESWQMFRREERQFGRIYNLSLKRRKPLLYKMRSFGEC